MKKIAACILSMMFMVSVLVPVRVNSVFADDEIDVNLEQGGGELGAGNYNITFDFNNGATYVGRDTYSYNMGSGRVVLNEPTLVSCFEWDEEEDICHSIDIKKGKALAYVKVNGERYEVDSEYIFNQDTTIVYYWDDIPLTEYEIDDGAGNSVVFEGESDHIYGLEVENYGTNMTKEEIEAAGSNVEEYEMIKAMIIGAIGEDSGTLLSFVKIEVFNEDGWLLHEGPFQIRLAMKEGMEGYDTYKLVYLDEDEEGRMVAGEAITLTLEDGFFVGTLPHLTAFALVGSDEGPDAPDSGVFSEVDGGAIYTSISLVTLISLAVCVLRIKTVKE